MVRGEGAWFVCVCISYTGVEGQLECNSVFSGLGSDLSVGRMFRGEGAWFVCVCISYTGVEGQLECNFLWSGRGDWGGQGNSRKSSQLNDK